MTAALSAPAVAEEIDGEPFSAGATLEARC